MRCLKWWAIFVHLTLVCLSSDSAAAQPQLTTVQDTLYKADGTRFNGVAYIEWKSFQAADSSVIATANIVVPIVDGSIRVRLVPTTNASPGAHYYVRYHADGRVQFTEIWNVPPSTSALNLAALRAGAGSTPGGSTNPPASISIGDITGLADELGARPIKGFGYSPNRILMTGPTGALEAVTGNLSDCIRVDGTTGPCGSSVSIVNSGPGFVDNEIPGGSTNGSNSAFTLSQSPSPAASLKLFRNGVLMKSGIDFTLSSSTVTFVPQAIPQSGDILLASYRLPGQEGPSGLTAGSQFAAPQVICAKAGNVTSQTASQQIGVCSIPAGVLQPGDRISILATLSHTGTAGGFSYRWKWGNTYSGLISKAATVSLLQSQGDIALHGGGGASRYSTIDSAGVVSDSVASLTDAYASGIAVAFEGAVNNAGDSVSLLQFTVVRYPKQEN